jgi:hypothetical protein
MQHTLCPWNLSPIFSLNTVSTAWQNPRRGSTMRIANNRSKHGHGGVPPFKCRQLHPHDTPTPRPSPSVFFFRAGTVPSAASASWLGPTQLHRVVAVRPTGAFDHPPGAAESQAERSFAPTLRARPGLSAAHIWNRRRLCQSRHWAEHVPCQGERGSSFQLHMGRRSASCGLGTASSASLLEES